MTVWLTHFIEQFGYLAILLLITIENIFPPIPSEAVLTLAGFLVTKTKLTALGVIGASTLGSLVGAIILFAVRGYHYIKIWRGIDVRYNST